MKLTDAMEKFKKYVENYNIEDGMIKLKIKHTYKVIEESEAIAKSIGLDEENVNLAKLIGLLHDIGRFEQIKQFRDYRDEKNIDHAELGVKLLFQEGLIRKFIREDQYDNIILKAIQNHNKFKIEDGLKEEELVHSKIIRDADKTDIFRVKIEEPLEAITNYTKEELENSDITDEVYQNVIQHTLIVNTLRKEPLDYWISPVGFVFDYHFITGLQHVQERNYINAMLDRINYKNEKTKQKIDNIKTITNEYMNQKIKESK